MESLESVCRRMEAFLEDIRALRDTDSLLVVTHAIALKGALEVLTPISRGSWWGRHIGNCAVFRTELRQGLFTEPEIIFSPGMESGP